MINPRVFNCESSASSAIAKLSKPVSAGGLAAKEAPQGEKKETPQERLKRIMSKQLNKQSMFLAINSLYSSKILAIFYSCKT